MKFALIILAYPFALFAQKVTVPHRDAPPAGMTIHHPRTEPYKTFYPDGKIKAEGFYYQEFDKKGNLRKGYVGPQGQFTEFLLDSLNIEYWPDGRRRSTVEYRKGKLHGDYIEWHPNGQMALNCKYIDNLRTGIWLEYYPSGIPQYQVLMENGLRNGIEQQWHPNGRPKAIIPYRDGQREGEATYFCSNGITQINAFYDDDQEVGTHYHYYCDGKPHAVYSYGGSEIYLEQFWDKSGEQLILDGYGSLSDYDSLKQERFEITYDMGQKNGPARFWFPNGKLKREGHFLNDLETGDWTFYAEDGTFLDKGTFVHGIRTDLNLAPRKD